MAGRLTPSVVGSPGFGCGRPPLNSPGSAPRRAKSPGGTNSPPLHASSIRQTPSALAATGSPTRYLSRPTGEPGGAEGDTPQTEAQGVKPTGVMRLTRLVDRRGRPPGPWGVRGAWEMAPRCRSAAQAPVNSGSPKTAEERTTGPDHEGTTRPRQDQALVNPGPSERAEEPTMGPGQEGTFSSAERVGCGVWATRGRAAQGCCAARGRVSGSAQPLMALRTRM